MQLTEVFADPRIKTFLDTHPEIQAHWVADMFCRNLANGYPRVHSNIEIWDLFGLGGTSQVGFVTKVITVIQISCRPESWKPSPQKEGGNYLEYEIGGDIGGWFYRQSHQALQSGYFIWLPTPERLLLAGMVHQADELSKLMREIITGGNS